MIHFKMFYPKVKIIAAAMAIFFVLCAAAGADVIKDIVRDFKPLPGYVVQRNGAELIVAVEGLESVSNGDLFSVLKPGKELIHPITKKVLGRLNETRAIIKIRRIKPGFAFARFIGKPGDMSDIKRGDPIGRYENMAAIFWDYTGKGRRLFNRLQSALPDLEWQIYDQAQRNKPPEPALPSENSNTLIFILKSGSLEVRDPDFALLHQYAYLPAGAAPAKTREPARPARLKFDQGIQPLGTINRAVRMADFILYQGKLLMATTDGKGVAVFKVEEDLIPVTKHDRADYYQVLSLKWWYPQEKGPLYLTMYSWSFNEVVARILTFDGHSLVPVGGETDKILGTFDLDGDQRPETLLGQEFDEDAFFGPRIYEVKLIDGRIRYFPPPLPLPWEFRVTGSLLADLTADGRPESIFVRSGILYIYSEKKLIATSAKQVGGSLSVLTYDINPDAKDLEKPTPTVYFEVPPVPADVDRDGRPELVAIGSDRSSVALPAYGLGIKRSWLSVFKLEDGRLARKKIGKELDSPIQGLSVLNKHIWVLVSEPDPLLFGGRGGNSRLYAWPVK